MLLPKNDPVVSQQRLRVSCERTAKKVNGALSAPPGWSSLIRNNLFIGPVVSFPIAARTRFHTHPYGQVYSYAYFSAPMRNLCGNGSCNGSDTPLPTASCQSPLPRLPPFTCGRKWAQTAAEWLRLRRRSAFKTHVTCTRGDNDWQTAGNATAQWPRAVASQKKGSFLARARLLPCSCACFISERPRGGARSASIPRKSAGAHLVGFHHGVKEQPICAKLAGQPRLSGLKAWEH